MSENRTLEQKTTAARRKKQRVTPALLIFAPAAIAVVAILLGYFTMTFPHILNLLTMGFAFLKNIFELFVKDFFGATGSFILALVLPAAVIVAKRLRIPLLTYGVFYGSIVFLAVQLLAILLCFILAFFTLDSGSFWLGVRNFFAFFSGSEVISSLLSMIKTPIKFFDELFIIGFVGILKRTVQMLGYTFNHGINALAELLFIAKNALCLYLAWGIMQRMKRRKNARK